MATKITRDEIAAMAIQGLCSKAPKQPGRAPNKLFETW
ncbi:unnamed protein product, partial [marine sediment metagenome]